MTAFQGTSLPVQSAVRPVLLGYDFDELDELAHAYAVRAKQLVVLAGSRRALAAAVRTVGGRRHTGLAHRLQTTP